MVLTRSCRVAFVASLLLVGASCGPSSDCTETATCPDLEAGDDAVLPMDSAGSADGTLRDAGGSADGSVTSEAGSAADAIEELPTLDVVIPADAPPCPTGSSCVDPVPTGWAGPLALFDQTGGPPAPSPPACPASYPTQALTGSATPSAPPATCACTCGAATGGGCAVTLSLYSDPTCTTLCGSPVAVPSQGGCAGGGCSGAQWARATGAASGGSCTPTPSTTLPAWGFTRTARACEVQSVTGGCAGGAWCVPAPPSPFSPKLCMAQLGDVACPAGAYSQKSLYFASAEDSRGCSPCTCGPADGGACSGETVDVFTTSSGGTCGGAQQTVSPGTCAPLGFSAQYASAHLPGSATGESCAPAAVTPKGQVTPAGPTTVCCQP